MKATILYKMMTLALFALLLPSCKQSGNDVRHVLVVHSYESSYEGYGEFNELIEDEFEKHNMEVELKFVYLNCEMYEHDDEICKMDSLIRSVEKEEWRPDLILVNEDQAHYSLLKVNHPWIKECPIVFGGVNFPNRNLLKEFDNVTGVQDSIDFATNIEVIKEITKSKEHIVIFSFIDSTFLDRKLHAEIERQLKGTSIQKTTSLLIRNAQTIENPYIPSENSIFDCWPIRNKPVQKDFWCLMHLNQKLPYYYLHCKTDYACMVGSDLWKGMKFTAINERFGYRHNLIAGYITTVPIQVSDMVKIAVEIFKGKKPADIPIRVSPKEYVADWFVLKKWDIDINTLNKKFHIINMPFNLRYRWGICITLAVIVTIVSVVIYRLYTSRKQETAKKKQALENLQKRNQEMEEANIKLNKQKKELITARELAEKAELKQSFLANMSHEIRTPLNAIVGFTNLLNDPEACVNLDEKERKDMVDIINHNNDLLLKLINDVLDLSRIESGNAELDLHPYEATKFVKEIYRTHEVIIRRNLQFELQLDKTPAIAMIDKLRFTQIIANFLSNANKFTTTGKITLGYHFDHERNEIQVYVEDTGCGITPEQQIMIFNRFYKTDEFAQGTGLGLSICQVIIERLGGRIEISSEVGKGSRFTAIVPGNIGAME